MFTYHVKYLNTFKKFTYLLTFLDILPDDLNNAPNVGKGIDVQETDQNALGQDQNAGEFNTVKGKKIHDLKIVGLCSSF